MTVISETLDASLLLGPMRDPAPLFAELREKDPVCWIDGLDTWLVTRHADVRNLFSDRRLTTDQRVYERYEQPTDPKVVTAMEKMPFRSTSADSESPGRRLVSAALTPRATLRMEAALRALVEEYAAPLRKSTGVADLMAQFTTPVTGTAIGRILGVPPKADDELRFAKLARNATRSIRPFLSEQKRLETARATGEISDYVISLVAERRNNPRPDMISDLLAAADETEGPASDDIPWVVAALAAAGTGTAATAGARALRALLRNPKQLALLRKDKELLPNAVCELLRYDSGQMLMPRYVREDFDFQGRPFRKGQLVMISIMGANRDPRVFKNPDVLDLRRDTSESMALGHGAHYCIGANLARLEMRLMIDAALDFLPPTARLLEDEIRWSARGMMSQIRSLPVDLSD